MLETVFKREEISGCDTKSVRRVDGMIPTHLDFIMIVSIIQALSSFQLIMNVEGCQAPFKIMELLDEYLEEEALKAATWLLNIRWLSLCQSNSTRAIQPTLISPPSYPNYLS